LGISPLPFGPLRQAQGPSESVEMTDTSSSGEPSMLTPTLGSGYGSLTRKKRRDSGFQMKGLAPGAESQGLLYRQNRAPNRSLVSGQVLSTRRTTTVWRVLE